MESIVNQAFADIKGADAELFVLLCGENTLVHTGAIVGRRKNFFETRSDIVGIEDAVSADVGHVFFAVGEEIGEGANCHEELPLETADSSD